MTFITLLWLLLQTTVPQSQATAVNGLQVQMGFRVTPDTVPSVSPSVFSPKVLRRSVRF